MSSRKILLIELRNKGVKRKLVFTIVGLFIFLICFTTSVFLRSYYNEKRLRKDIHKITVGMTEREVIQILGKPNSKFISDVPDYIGLTKQVLSLSAIILAILV